MDRLSLIRDFPKKIHSIALKYFRRSIPITNKNNKHFAGGFDPVTEADQEIETYLRSKILHYFPDDTIIGEENIDIEGGSGFEWVIDPIDGTRAFMIGQPSFMSLVSLHKKNETIAAIASQAFTNEVFEVIEGKLTYYNSGFEGPLKTRSPQELKLLRLATTFPEIGSKEEKIAFERLSAKVQITRYGMDAYAYMLCAMGQLDLVVEASLNRYDLEAPMAIVNAAGGYCCDWQGGQDFSNGRSIAASSEEVAMIAVKELNYQ